MTTAAPPRVAVVDYGMGNLASVVKALDRSGADARVCDGPAQVREAAAVVLPGVGAFRDAAARLEQSGLAEAVLERHRRRYPVPGRVPRTAASLREQRRGRALARPRRLRRHGGAAADRPRRCRTSAGTAGRWTAAGSGMARGLPDPAAVYFVHWYAAVPADEDVVAAWHRLRGSRGGGRGEG